MANLYYALAPWEWRADLMSGSWNPPASCVGAIDLGDNPSQLVGGSDRGIGLFACTEAIPGTLNTTSGDLRDIAATSLMQDAFQTEAGYRPDGVKLIDLIYDVLLNGDPTGNDRCKPLVPESGSELTVWLPGHSKIMSDGFAWGSHRHTNRLRDLLRADFAATLRDAENEANEHRKKAKTEPDKKIKDALENRAKQLDVLPAKCLGGLAHKYFGKWDDPRQEEFLTDEIWRNGFRSQRPTTSYSDDFSGTLAAWTAQSGTWAISSGQLRKTASSATNQFIRYDSGVSSVDHEVSITNNASVVNNANGPASRVNFSGGQTAYTVGPWSNVDYLVVFNPSQTNIASVGLTYASGRVYLVKTNGSTIKGFSAGVQRTSVTNTAVSAGVRGGVVAYEINQNLDDWLIDDLVVAGGGLPLINTRRNSLIGR